MGSMGDAQSGQPYQSWKAFCGARLDYVSVLAETVEQSFIRRVRLIRHSVGVSIGIPVSMAPTRY